MAAAGRTNLYICALLAAAGCAPARRDLREAVCPPARWRGPENMRPSEHMEMLNLNLSCDRDSRRVETVALISSQVPGQSGEPGAPAGNGVSKRSELAREMGRKSEGDLWNCGVAYKAYHQCR